MAEYLVEMRGESREVYLVIADSPEQAALKWSDGALVLQEPMGFELYSVEEEIE